MINIPAITGINAGQRGQAKNKTGASVKIEGICRRAER